MAVAIGGLTDAQSPQITEGKGVITGVVRDPSGQPVIYATVWMTEACS